MVYAIGDRVRYTNPTSGKVADGSVIRVNILGMPAGAALEVEWDDFVTWPIHTILQPQQMQNVVKLE